MGYDEQLLVKNFFGKIFIHKPWSVDHLVIPNFLLAVSRIKFFCPAIRMAPSKFKNFGGKTGHGPFEVLFSDLCSKNKGPLESANFEAVDNKCQD